MPKLTHPESDETCLSPSTCGADVRASQVQGQPRLLRKTLPQTNKKKILVTQDLLTNI